MNIYIRKLKTHDITHQISITREVLHDFFEESENGTSANVKGIKTNHVGKVVFLTATDPRLGGDITRLLNTEGGANEGDFLLFTKLQKGEYLLDIIKPLDDRHSVFLSLLKNERHLIVHSSPSPSSPLSPPSSLTPYLSAIRTKPFILLAGISGTGKSRIARRLAQASVTFELQNSESNPLDPASFDSLRWSLQKPENFELIQVKPNWHSSMDVIGYLTNIPSPHYFLTPFVRFIAKAWQHTDVPFFLCLDEMNLAPVEEYFAEFLSAIESRSKDKGGKFQTDPIIPPFESFGADVRKQMVNELFPEVDNDKATEEPLTSIIKRFKSQGLTLPPNLVVIGTVNMDETTFSFSRKVLDRAMSFEMNEVDYDRFLEGCADVVGSPLSDEERKALTDRPIDALEVKDTVDAEKVIDYLKVLNGVLDGTPFKLGYRAANEALLFASAARLFGCDDLLGALDDFTLMKVLSRIEGDSNKLKVGDNGDDKTLLDRLFEVIKGELGDGEEVKCLKKLQRMIASLERSGFVSYWE